MILYSCSLPYLDLSIAEYLADSGLMYNSFSSIIVGLSIAEYLADSGLMYNSFSSIIVGFLINLPAAAFIDGISLAISFYFFSSSFFPTIVSAGLGAILDLVYSIN
jgi:hypothetical protein